MIVISLTIIIKSDQKRSVGPVTQTVNSLPAPSRELQLGGTWAVKCSRQVPFRGSTSLYYSCHSLNIFFFQSKGTLWDSSCYLTLIRDRLKRQRRGRMTLPDHRSREKTSRSRCSRFPALGWRRDCLGTRSLAARHPPTVPAAAFSRQRSKSQKPLWATELPLAPGSSGRAGPRSCTEVRCTSVLIALGKTNGTRVGKGKENYSNLAKTPIAFFSHWETRQSGRFCTRGWILKCHDCVFNLYFKKKSIDAL